MIWSKFSEPDEGAGKHHVRPAERLTVRALLRAFDPARSDSGLLVTSRFPFQLFNGESDLADRLCALQLPPFGPSARSKLRLRQIMVASHRPSGLASLNEASLAERAPLLDKAVDLARGNPGLQDLICDKLLLNPVVALDKSRAYWRRWKSI